MPLIHIDVESKTDEQLTAEATAYLAANAPLLFMSETLTLLRELSQKKQIDSWWNAQSLRKWYPTAERLEALTSRPDIRQKITSGIAGTPPKATRKMLPALQAQLIDAVVDSDDVGLEEYEGHFAPDDIVIYLDMNRYWLQIFESFPWNDDAAPHRLIFQNILESLLKSRKTTSGEKPKSILTAWQVIEAIEPKEWLEQMPLDVRIKLHSAWLAQEKKSPMATWHANDVLAIATPEIIARTIHLNDLGFVFKRAGEVMGFWSDADEEGINSSHPKA